MLWNVWVQEWLRETKQKKTIADFCDLYSSPNVLQEAKQEGRNGRTCYTYVRGEKIKNKILQEMLEIGQ